MPHTSLVATSQRVAPNSSLGWTPPQGPGPPPPRGQNPRAFRSERKDFGFRGKSETLGLPESVAGDGSRPGPADRCAVLVELALTFRAFVGEENVKQLHFSTALITC